MQKRRRGREVGQTVWTKRNGESRKKRGEMMEVRSDSSNARWSFLGRTENWEKRGGEK